MLDFALQYAARGWPIFQVSGHKIPFKGSHGHLDATTDPAIIHAWFKKRPKANLALATGAIVVLDLDGPKAFESPRGRELLATAQANGGLPRTLTAKTARGVHLYYAAPPGATIRSSNERRDAAGSDGVDIKGHGGFVVLPPSVNAKSHFQYTWLHDVPIAPMPAWLYEWCQGAGAVSQSNISLQALGAKPDYLKQNQPATAKTLKASLGVEYNAAELQRILSALKVIPADHYDTWIEVGMALHSLGWERSDGTEIGFDIWDRWSATCPAKYNPIGMADKWNSFGRTGRSEISIATLFHHANRHGWQPPAPAAVDPERKVIPNPTGPTGEASPHPAQPPPGGVNGTHLPSALTTLSNSESPLIKLNENYAVIGDIGGKCLVMGWVGSKVDDTVYVPSFQTFKSFAERLANQYVMASKPKGDEWVYEPQQLGTAWLKWSRRRTYDGLDMVPNGPAVLPNNHLNLWRGLSVQPVQGQWPLMRMHIAKVLARGNMVALEYILKWAAWKLQKPGECPQVALVFKGPKGAGKGTFARTLRQFFGAHGLQVFNSKHLVGQFNAHFRNCLLLYADEAFWAGDKQGESTLKGLITEPTIPIEQKGVDLVDWKNRIALVMTTNAEWVVPASHDERRYAVFEVDDTYARNEDYFNALLYELDHGGREAMLYDLLHLDLGNWHPRRVPETKALQQQKLRSLDPRFEWFENLLSEGTLMGTIKGTYMIPMHFLHGQAKEVVPKLRDISQAALGRFLADMGCEKVHQGGGNAWRFDALTEHRQRWTKRFGDWQWSYGGPDWVVR